jgi:hypothetical protein
VSAAGGAIEMCDAASRVAPERACVVMHEAENSTSIGGRLGGLGKREKR